MYFRLRRSDYLNETTREPVFFAVVEANQERHEAAQVSPNVRAEMPLEMIAIAVLQTRRAHAIADSHDSPRSAGSRPV